MMNKKNTLLLRDEKKRKMSTFRPKCGTSTSYSKSMKYLSKFSTAYSNLEKNLPSDFPTPPKNRIRLGTGSPANFRPFKPALTEIYKVLKCKKYYKTPLSHYPDTQGEELMRKKFLTYIKSLNFQATPPVSIENIIFTSGTTEAFALLCSIIGRPGDVILMTAPNYGLFCFIPEDYGLQVEFLKLKKENNWLPDLNELSNKIDSINNQLKNTTLYKYTPRVVAYLHMNPHNPTGKVLGSNERPLLEKIANICKKKGLYLIDDLVYRDLGFDASNLALPISSLPEMFSNTISLFSLSKSFGLAGLRAGAVVANKDIIMKLRSFIFYYYGGISALQSAAMAGAFNASKLTQIYSKYYFKKLLKLYEYRLNLLLALIYGIQNIKEKALFKKIKKSILKECKTPEDKLILNGISQIKIVPNTYPESGFFLLLDLSSLKNMWYYTHQIKDELDLMRFIFCETGVTFVPGQAFAWPDREQLIARISFSVEEKEIILAFIRIKKAISVLRKRS